MARSAARSRAGGAALGGEARRGALQHAAQLDGVAHVALGELAHDVAAAGQAAQQALVLELGQRQAQRGAAHAQQLDQRQLRHSFTRARTGR